MDYEMATLMELIFKNNLWQGTGGWIATCLNSQINCRATIA